MIAAISHPIDNIRQSLRFGPIHIRYFSYTQMYRLSISAAHRNEIWIFPLWWVPFFPRCILVYDAHSGTLSMAIPSNGYNFHAVTIINSIKTIRIPYVPTLQTTQNAFRYFSRPTPSSVVVLLITQSLAVRKSSLLQHNNDGEREQRTKKILRQRHKKSIFQTTLDYVIRSGLCKCIDGGMQTSELSAEKQRIKSIFWMCVCVCRLRRAAFLNRSRKSLGDIFWFLIRLSDSSIWARNGKISRDFLFSFVLETKKRWIKHDANANHRIYVGWQKSHIDAVFGAPLSLFAQANLHYMRFCCQKSASKMNLGVAKETKN